VSQLYIFICTKTTPDAVLPVQTANQADYNRRVSNTFKAQAGGRLVVGDLKLRPDGKPIANHLLCDGSAVSRISFPELFAYLGTTEGAGDGATTFNLPNYLGSPLEVPATAPVQTTTPSGTITTPPEVPVTQPTAPAETGGTQGGNVISGGRAEKGPRPQQQ
jgi:hypothetical protein